MSSLPPPFTAIFVVALLLNAGATLRSSDLYKHRIKSATSKSTTHDSSQLTTEETREWNTLLRKYMIVYLLATASDWLQGPYVYALYSDYGYSQHQIAVLFVAGFGSSMVFGSFIGGMADWGGRKRFVMVFCLIYAASCATKREYKLCMFG
jgi:Na+/melibiose symporter-like transporter